MKNGHSFSIEPKSKEHVKNLSLSEGRVLEVQAGGVLRSV